MDENRDRNSLSCVLFNHFDVKWSALLRRDRSLSAPLQWSAWPSLLPLMSCYFTLPSNQDAQQYVIGNMDEVFRFSYNSLSLDAILLIQRNYPCEIHGGGCFGNGLTRKKAAFRNLNVTHWLQLDASIALQSVATEHDLAHHVQYRLDPIKEYV